ncbi:MAG TPA: GAF domain-containing protein, partial [Terriglobales bacterium]|nr:GAF domain-containing protein [Terriglobales bacterium]
MTSAVLKSIAQRAAKFCSADDVQIHVVEGTVLRCVADYGNLPASAGRELIPISPDFVAGKAVRERRTIYLRNLAVRSGRKPSRRAGDGYHSILVAPLMCDGAAIGTISLGRKQLHPFSDEQVELLESFANEAAITIENTRLVNELQERNKALTESLEQQTATSEILHVISQSQQDAQPVFETIAASAQKLCRAQIGTVFTFDGELVHAAALHSISPEGLEAVQRAFPMPPSRAGGTPRAILTRAVAYIRDVREDPDLDHQLKSLAEVAGYRSVLSVPMLRDGSPIGAISVTGVQPAMFTERQIAMLKTFADQAVIAIENTRLFNELQERLEQQTATSDILRVISQSQRDVQPVFETIAANARKLCRGLTGVVYTFDGELIHVAALGDVVRTEASDEMRRAYPMPPSRGAASGRAILSGTVAYIRDVREDPEYRLRTSQAAGTPCVVAVPLLRDGRPIGAITVSGGEPGMFTERQIAMLQTFADQAVIAIENTRLFNELETRNRDLTEALEQQTATSEILRVISSSPTNLQPVLDTIARSAAHFCNASDVNVYRVGGDSYWVVARHGSIPVSPTDEHIPVRRDLVSGRAIIERSVVHVPDLLAESDADFAGARAFATRLGYRAMLAVPMLREGVAIGAIALRSAEVRPFTNTQIELLKTFADQAVIAIENTRLFNELQTRNRDLTEALEQQTATSEILRVISQAQSDVQPVFEAIATNARKLCRGTSGVVFTFDGELVRVA